MEKEQTETFEVQEIAELRTECAELQLTTKRDHNAAPVNSKQVDTVLEASKVPDSELPRNKTEKYLE